jgi:Tetratricopeptide repeat
VEEAVAQFQQLLTDQTRVLGADHPATLTTRSNLAHWLGEAGRIEEAVTQFEQLLTDRTRVLGADHPATFTTRNNLAYWLDKAGCVIQKPP